jgi:hypothetical protein
MKLATDCLEAQRVLDADSQALQRHGWLTTFLLALILVHRPGLQNVQESEESDGNPVGGEDGQAGPQDVQLATDIFLCRAS